MAYATPAQLAAYVGESADLPSETEQERLLERASELVDAITLGRIDSDNDDDTEAAQKAVCAQVEYWLQADESADVTGAVTNYRIGSIGETFASGSDGAMPRLARRARSHLFLAGLLYRGIRTT